MLANSGSVAPALFRACNKLPSTEYDITLTVLKKRDIISLCLAFDLTNNL